MYYYVVAQIISTPILKIFVEHLLKSLEILGIFNFVFSVQLEGSHYTFHL